MIPFNFHEFMNGIFSPLPPMGLENYQRYFQLYDRFHSPKLGPEPTKEALLAAAETLKREGKPYAEALLEASECVQS